jgi:hypothetical protein
MKKCIHKYLLECKTNPQPPGFADFLRGTISLFYFSQKYNFELFIDCEHPLFKFLKPNSKFILSESSDIILELLPPLSYYDIYFKLEDIFKTGQSFSLITNSFYDYQNGSLSNFGNISDNCRYFMQDILQPSIEIENRLNYLFKFVYNINLSKPFKVIHLRCGDTILHNDIYDDSVYNMSYNQICNIMNKDINIDYILISDSFSIANKLKQNIHGLHYIENRKIHMGDLKFCEKNVCIEKNDTNSVNSMSNEFYDYYNNLTYSDSAIFDTLVDFFLMSKSNTIFAVKDSGFSKSVSTIFNIPYIIL